MEGRSRGPHPFLPDPGVQVTRPCPRVFLTLSLGLAGDGEMRKRKSEMQEQGHS